MSDNQQYSLWFVNQSGSAGKACVYHDSSNIKPSQSNPVVLAWMLTGVNPSVWANFIWTTGYNFAWFDYDSPQTQQIITANIDTDNSAPLSYNQYGYSFGKTKSDSTCQLSVQSDGSIPVDNNTVAGIGMHGAGTFAFPSQPNVKFSFAPTPDAKLVYCISFGAYVFEVNDKLDTDILNPPGKITFPSGVSTMTAVLDSSNKWTTHSGKPRDATGKETFIRYEAGKGILS